MLLVLAYYQYLVRLAGIEPAHLSARDFKSLVSTYFTTVACLVEMDGFEPPCFLGARFTVWCNQPLCHISNLVLDSGVEPLLPG